MALNKYMHPRNIYKSPPDFTKLAKSFEEFSNIAKTDVTGKVSIDFKSPHCLRVLTKCLLKSDFGLDVVIPEDRLVPTLPLRLNYILWIEDLLNSIDRKDNIKGLDIGTGACAIYPLLAATNNKWFMVGTESDQESWQKAQENIDRNNLHNLIKLSKNSTSTLLEYLFNEEDSETFDFSMCNPPFYSSIQELCESRSPARLPPKNGFTGSPQELITEGGELAFCRKMINESKIYKDKVLLFSTMVGHKYNMKELVQDLKAEGIKHTTTEFCQGRVTRWGLAWTYQDFDINTLVPGRDKLRKKNIPIVYLLPELKDSPYNFDTVSKKLQEILKILKINYKVINKNDCQLSLVVNAMENTWTNQRRKRRLMKLQQELTKKAKLNQSSDAVDGAAVNEMLDTNDKRNTEMLGEKVESSHVDDSNKDSLKISDKPEQINNSTVCADINKNGKRNEENKRVSYSELVENISYSFNNPSKKHDSRDSAVLEFSESNTEPLVHAFFKLLKRDNNILLEMEFLHGTAGKEGVHQIMQYIKNNWK